MAYLLGRPLTAEIHQFIYTHANNLNDLKTIRCLTLTLFAIDAGCLANIFIAFGLSVFESLILSISVFILPGVQDAIIMLAIQNALAILFTLWAYQISCRIEKYRIENALKNLSVISLILMSMFLYPQWSFFIFVPILIKYLLSTPAAVKRVYQEIFKLAVLFTISSLFYYFYIKTFISVHNARAGAYAFTIDLNFLFWKFFSVFTKILPMSFNFWNIYTISWLGFLLMGLTLILLRKKTILTLLFLFSTVSFWLLIRTDIVLHRIFYVTAVMALLAFFIGIRKVFNKDLTKGNYLIVGILTAALACVSYLNYFNTLNYYLEFYYVQQTLLEYQEPYSRIHMVLAEPSNTGYNGYSTVDDTFNAKTSSFKFSTDALNLLRAALKENGVPGFVVIDNCEDNQQACVMKKLLKNHLLVTHSNQDQAVNYSPHMVLIDMSKL